jgi:OST-HTH/LOTUS domain
VIGSGERKTPRPFVATCDRFVYTELLGPEAPSREAAGQKPAADRATDTRLVTLIRGAVEAASDDTGWASLGAVGRNTASQLPEFDARTYGYPKLSELMAALPLFEMEERRQGEGPSKALYVRNAAKRASKRAGDRR